MQRHVNSIEQNVFDYSSEKCEIDNDNNENNDCMLPGKGNFDFSLLFKELQADGYKGACLIEVYRHAYSDYSELFEAYDYVKNIHNNIDKVR